MPQSIIVYRNPAEAAFWEMFMSSAYTFPLIVSVVVAVICAQLFQKLIMPRLPEFIRRATLASWLTLNVALVSGVATFVWMVWLTLNQFGSIMLQ